jgi:hypothetical protein
MPTNMETAIEFANKVRTELSHLTSEQIADLTDGLEADIASSLDDGADIGSAEKYATDLLAAAGMSKGVEVVPNPVDVFINKIRRWSLSISDLEPAWWIFRAWVITQLIGWLLLRDQSSSPGYLEWRYWEWGGVVVLGVMLYMSVRIGRSKPTKWKIVISISHVVLAVAGLAFMFVPPSGETAYLEPLPGQTLCTQVPAPDLVGLSVADPNALLSGMGMGWTFFDQDAMVQLDSVPQEVLVIQQNPEPGVKTCQVYAVQLIVDLARPRATDLPPGLTTPPTVLPPEPVYTIATTTIPKKSVTTTIPKATTTTTP